MTKKALKVLMTLALCLCAMLLCGCQAAAETRYRVILADFGSKVRPYCDTVELSNESSTVTNTELITAGQGELVTIRITPKENCSVQAITYTYMETGAPTRRETCVLDRDASGAVSTFFYMPGAQVNMTVAMRSATYRAYGTYEHCTVTISDGTATGADILAEAGSQLTITAVPEEGYEISKMSYLTMTGESHGDIAFTLDGKGRATGTLTMPADEVYLDVTCKGSGVYYLSCNESGASQGSKPCIDYQLITNSSASWYDLNGNGEAGGWYVVRGNVTLSSDTTLRITGSVHLILEDGAKLTAGDGVYIKKGSSLSIYGQKQGTGKLIAKPQSGPGIGGMANTVGGSLYIHGGVIEATGGTNAAGIGGGNHASGYQNIVIYGGKVTAKGGSSGAGIGKGQQNSPDDCGQIIIYGGEVHASSTKYGAGIGGGEDRDGGTITIRGGTVTAEGGHDGAGIGGGEGGSGGRITISGGSVTATGGSFGAGIGGGEHGSGGTIEIVSGYIEAQGGIMAAGIGGGKGTNGGSISIRGGTVKAHGSLEGEVKDAEEPLYSVGVGGGAAIGGGRKGNAGTISISGGTVRAYADRNKMGGAAIGAGSEAGGGAILISGGTISAHGSYGAGIGSGASASCTASITITGGTIDQASSGSGAGIGAAYSGDLKAKITISGGTVSAFSGQGGAGIGAGMESASYNPDANGGECKSTIEITGGTVTASVAENDPQGQAIGHGGDGDEEGTLTLGDAIRVTNGAGFFDAGQRISGSRGRYVRIEPCVNHEVRTDEEHPYGVYPYQVSEETHIGTCSYCGTVMPAEAHVSKDGICTVCGYNTNAVTITFLPGDDRAEGEMPSVDYPISSRPLIPNCAFELAGYEFNGWQLDSTATVLEPGTEYELSVDIVLTALWRNNWTDLQAAIDQAENGDVIQLKGETVASPYDSALTVPVGRTIVLDLNGCTLSRELTEPAAGGHVIINSGYLRIRDSAGGGVITGGYGAAGSDGGAIVNRRTLILESGTISGNRAVNSGGAIYNDRVAIFDMAGGTLEGNSCGIGGGGAVVNYGTLNLSGGTMTGNTSGRNGGAIWSNGALNISGGTVTGNSAAAKGGAVCAAGGSYESARMRLSGSAVIQGNTSDTLGVNNVHFDSIETYAVFVGSFEDSSLIGITCTKTPTAGSTVRIVYGVSHPVPQIVSDRSEYELAYLSEYEQVHLVVAREYTVTVAEGIAHGAVTADPASCRAGGKVTLIVTPEEDYVLSSLTVTPEGGEAQKIRTDAEGAYSFTMPAANVLVGAEFVGDQTSAGVRLVWEDDQNAGGTRPEKVTVTLLDLGENLLSQELSANNEWTHTQTGLPMDHNGELASYAWTVLEENMPAGYSLSSSTEGGLTTLTLRPAYAVTVAESEHGTVRADKQKAGRGETVTLTAEPEQGYTLTSLTCAWTEGGEAVSLETDEETGRSTFVMPAAAVTVTAAFEEKPSDWQALQQMINEAQEGAIVALTQVYTGRAGDAGLLIPEGKKITIDLNNQGIDGGDSGVRIFTVKGGELTIEGNGFISGGLTENSMGGAFIVQGGGSLTLNGGTLRGNSAYHGGGAVAVTNGTFTMNDGYIQENESASHGGGVYVQGGTVVLRGGAVQRNKSEENGGGLWAGEGSTLRVTEGVLDSNSAVLGEDMYLNGVGMAVSGCPTIGEVYVTSPVITVEGPLEPAAEIGITCSNSAARKGTVLTAGLPGNGGLSNFPSAKKAYATELSDDGEVMLAAGLTVTLDMNRGQEDSGEDSSRMIYVVSGKPVARPENPVREGYIFLNWQLNGEEYDFDTPVTEEIVLKAQWIERPDFGTPDFTLPEEIKSIEENAFEGAAMTVVYIPDGCRSIGDGAFRDCRLLTRIRVPAGCAMGGDVFSGCGTVFVFGAAGSPAEEYCAARNDCVFVAE